MSFNFWQTQTGKEINAYITQLKMWMGAILVIATISMIFLGLINHKK